MYTIYVWNVMCNVHIYTFLILCQLAVTEPIYILAWHLIHVVQLSVTQAMIIIKPKMALERSRVH